MCISLAASHPLRLDFCSCSGTELDFFWICTVCSHREVRWWSSHLPVPVGGLTGSVGTDASYAGCYMDMRPMHCMVIYICTWFKLPVHMELNINFVIVEHCYPISAFWLDADIIIASVWSNLTRGHISAAWHWLHPILDELGMDESDIQGVPCPTLMCPFFVGSGRYWIHVSLDPQQYRSPPLSSISVGSAVFAWLNHVPHTHRNTDHAAFDVSSSSVRKGVLLSWQCEFAIL